MSFKNVTDNVLLTYTDANLIAGSTILEAIQSNFDRLDKNYHNVKKELRDDNTFGIRVSAIFGFGEQKEPEKGFIYYTPTFKIKCYLNSNLNTIVSRLSDSASSRIMSLCESIDNQPADQMIERALNTEFFHTSSPLPLVIRQMEGVETSPSDDLEKQKFFDSQKETYSFFPWMFVLEGLVSFLQDSTTGMIYALDQEGLTKAHDLASFVDQSDNLKYLSELTYSGNKLLLHKTEKDLGKVISNISDNFEEFDSAEPDSSSNKDDTFNSNSSDAEPQATKLADLPFVSELTDVKEPYATFRKNDATVQTLLSLNRDTHNNVIIYGKPGVGKTALVSEIAYILKNNTSLPKNLLDKHVWLVNTMGLIAGTSLRGQAEQRVNELLTLADKEKNVILFFDEIQSIINMDRGHGTTGIFDYLRPALSNGQLQIIGTTTDSELGIIKSDSSLKRRFSFVEVKEIDEATTKLILKQVAPSIPEAIFDDVIRLSSEYIKNRANPDRSLDLLSGVTALVSYYHSVNEHTYTPTHQDVLNALSNLVGFTVTDKIANNQSQGNISVYDKLKSHIFGQDTALHQISNVLDGIQMGIRTPHHPLGSILMFGSSGVGKTETAQTIAEILSDDKDSYLKIDMSEFSSYEALYQMIGSKNDASDLGILGNHLINHRKAVVLFDEFDKSATFVRTILLQILDNAKFNTGAGVPVDVSDAVILVTTNAGDEFRRTNPIGFDADSLESSETKLLESNLPPELIGRFDVTVEFVPLDSNSLALIAKKEIKDLQVYSSQLGVTLEISDGTLHDLMQQARKTKTGARFVKSRIKELAIHKIKTMLDSKPAQPGHQRPKKAFI